MRRDMSLFDPYLELELYLEKAQDEIAQALEQSAIIKRDITPKSSTGEPADESFRLSVNMLAEQTDWDMDVFLAQFEQRVASDVEELLSRCSLDDKRGGEKAEDAYIVQTKDKCDGLKCLQTDELYFDDVYNEVVTDGEFEMNGSAMTLNSLKQFNDSNSTNTTGTQTSPSQSWTNLTCWSDCSSPCILSIDRDIVEDTVSLVSADAFEKHLYFCPRSIPWQPELHSKSSSVPILQRSNEKVNKQARSQSDRHLSEIEATEACKWLRAAGFPQYAQMYEDQQFPVDIAAAERDHPMLEPSVLNSLFRRLQALNRCAVVHQQRVTHTDDSEDEQCALSYNWTYQTDLRRWSRVDQQLEIPSNIEEWQGKVAQSKPTAETSQPSSNEPNRFRRIGSTRHRRRNRDGIVISDSGSHVLDYLSKQLSSLNTSDPDTHASDSESSARYGRQKKTRSLDKNETWGNHSSPYHERFTWKTLANTEEVEENKLDLEEGGRPISTLSCTQLQVLRKLALLKLTAHMEKYCPTHKTGWNWDLPKLIRKMKNPAYREKTVFGVPLTVILQRTGSSLPRGIEEALQWLHQSAYDQVGLFRKSGVKSRIQNLKYLIESQGECVNFSEYQAYDIADMIKQYFRDLPEALLTNKLSETFILIFQHVPIDERRQAVLCALLLMPDEHCEVLLALLKFLTNIAEHSNVNQMNESNLAVCFAPSLFHYNMIPTNRQGLGAPHPRELAENKAAHDCLLYLIQNCDNIFNVPKELLQQCTSTEMNESIAVQLSDLGADTGGWKRYLLECEHMLLREVREKGWLVVQTYYPRVDLAYKKVADGHPLRLWKICAEIEAPPKEVLYRILKERPKWDDELHSTRTVAQIDRNVEIFQYTRRNISPLPLEDYCVVRTWKTDLSKGACTIIEASVEHPDAINIPNSVRGIVLASRYLIEPCGSGRSRLIYLSRIDTRGRMPEWYHKNFGHICAMHLSNIQYSFKQTAVGPESLV